MGTECHGSQPVTTVLWTHFRGYECAYKSLSSNGIRCFMVDVRKGRERVYFMLKAVCVINRLTANLFNAILGSKLSIKGGTTR